ncbi:MAG: YggS family pyridoxal phosphate-dependent enzyme [Candidatus Omnitrophica bacterium]|nr:YggS family pyridoxal phosphate-dependent enzyme [Candidatus Omnitrophota bacterium]
MLSYCVANETMIAENLKAVTQRISRSCEKSGRPADGVKLVCVAKEASLAEIEEVLALGVKDIGENRVQDALVKYRAIGGRAIWHLIGHLQTNKVRDAVGISSLIHSVDSLRLAEAIDREAKRAGKVQDILIQVNTSGQVSKFGISQDEVRLFFEKAVLYPNISILGLMTMAPEVEDPEETRPCFRSLRELRDELQNYQPSTMNYELSMGMTNDFEIAIEEGSTMVRIGRAIFDS